MEHSVPRHTSQFFVTCVTTPLLPFDVIQKLCILL